MVTSLAPALLLSMPQLIDPNFRQTVVLLCAHDEASAFGLVVNRPVKTQGSVVLNVEPPVTSDRDIEVWLGGPVDMHRSWVLVGDAADVSGEEGETRISEGLYLSTAPDLVRRLFDPTPPPRARLIAGYAGWGPGQLDAELKASAWLLSDVDRDLIFDTPADRMWEAAIRRLGADLAALQMSRGIH